jgi:hypothetical protein
MKSIRMKFGRRVNFSRPRQHNPLSERPISFGWEEKYPASSILLQHSYSKVCINSNVIKCDNGTVTLSNSRSAV